MAIELGEKKSVLGRELDDLEKYGERGTAYLGKVVMSAGEKPVLGRKILVDIAKPHLILICGKRGGGKCLDGDTLITLADGSVKKIRELEHDANKVLALDHAYKVKPAEKTEFFKRTVNKMLEITLRSGKKIRLTPEHPLLTVGGWRPAEELGVGSRIATPRKLACEGNGFLRECEVKLLAYLISEGHTKRRAVWFSNQDKTLVEDFRQAVKEFDARLEVHASPKDNYRVVNPGHRQIILKAVRKNGKFAKGTVFQPQNPLREWMKGLGVYGYGSYEKRVPEEVFRLPRQKIALFLNRLFSGDGTIYFDTNTKAWRVSYASASEELIRQVQHLLLRFEIMGVLRQKKTRSNGKEFHSFELELRGANVERFLKVIGFYGAKEFRQRQALAELPETRNANLDTVPREIWDYYRPQSWTAVAREIGGYAYPKALRESMKYAPTRQKLLQIAQADKNELIQMLASSDIYWDEIKQVKELTGEFEVFDLSVPGPHNFVANDVIVHNSYSMAVLLEEMARQPPEIRKRLSVITIDTVGIFWTLKIPDRRNAAELAEWDLQADKTNVKVLVPKGKLEFYLKKGLPVDGAFTIKVSEIGAEEWLALFKLTWKDAEGVLLARVLERVQESLGTFYGLDELIIETKKDDESEKLARQALANRFEIAKTWGLLEKEGTKMRDLAAPGEITIIDVSAYRQAIGMQGTRDIIVGLIGKKLFEERMLFRKEEEVKVIQGLKRESAMPIVWMFIDEAHMFMPKDEDNIALQVLLEWVRVGRQPGLGLVLATQRPNKLHADAISQADLFISHRLTAQPDIDAVAELRPSYMAQDFGKYYQEMPRSRGFAVVLDDNTEKMWLIKMRPRFSWDGGVTASAFSD